MVVLRNVLSGDVARNLVTAGHDLVRNATRHCEMTKFTGPPLFHGYDRYCGRAQLVHDYLRDVIYKTALPYVAAQLLDLKNEEEPIRQVADTFMAGRTIPRRWHSDYLSFANFARYDDNATNCGNGVVMWLPLQDTTEDSNGMIFINGSSRDFDEYFAGGGAGGDADNNSHARPADARDFFSYMKWLESLPKDEYVAPNVSLGDAIVFDACTVHSSSGVNTASPSSSTRQAYQLRFLRDFDFVTSGKKKRGRWYKRLLFPSYPVLPVASPQLWPQTLKEEDAIRSAGHVIYTRWDWIGRLIKAPVYTLISCLLALRTKLLVIQESLHCE